MLCYYATKPKSLQQSEFRVEFIFLANFYHIRSNVPLHDDSTYIALLLWEGGVENFDIDVTNFRLQ